MLKELQKLYKAIPEHELTKVVLDLYHNRDMTVWSIAQTVALTTPEVRNLLKLNPPDPKLQNFIRQVHGVGAALETGVEVPLRQPSREVLVARIERHLGQVGQLQEMTSLKYETLYKIWAALDS